MPLNEIYRKPFKKATIFLYPLLGIAKGVLATPESIHVEMENVIEKEDMKLICVYNTTISNFESFASKVLTTNVHFLERIQINDSQCAFIFDLSRYEKTWNAFLNAKYSQFEENSKKLILKYFRDNTANVIYITSYLYPEKYFHDYARILLVDVELLMEVGELCSKPNFEEEKLKIKSLAL
jgi:hypothetical protein